MKKPFLLTGLFSILIAAQLFADVILRDRGAGTIIYFPNACYSDFPNASDMGWDCFQTKDCGSSSRAAGEEAIQSPPDDIRRAMAQEGYVHLEANATEVADTWQFDWAGYTFAEFPKSFFKTAEAPRAYLVKEVQPSTTMGSPAAFANLIGMSKLRVAAATGQTGSLRVIAELGAPIEQPERWLLHTLDGRLIQHWDFAAYDPPLELGEYKFDLGLQQKLRPNQYYLLTLENASGEAVLTAKFPGM